MKKVPKKELKVDFGLHNMSSKCALWYAHAYLRPWWDFVNNSFTLGKFPKLYLGLTWVLYLNLKFRATQRERHSDFHILVCTMHYLLSAFLMCCLPKIAVRVTELKADIHTVALEPKSHPWVTVPLAAICRSNHYIIPLNCCLDPNQDWQIGS